MLEQIYDYIENNPGCTTRAVGQEFGLSAGKVRKNVLPAMEGHGLLLMEVKPLDKYQSGNGHKSKSGLAVFRRIA